MTAWQAAPPPPPPPILPALSERARWALVVAAGALLLVAIDVWWVATYRHGYPLDVDEAGYTTIALADYFGLRGGGLHGWWEVVQSQTPNAPLVPAITSLIFVVKAGMLEGFATLIGFLVLLAFAIYGIAERLVGPRLGALAALVVATSPGAFAFTREFIFALPTAALLACAVYALLRSEGLRRRRWAIASGTALGLMLLTRTMAVAFVPGVLVAAVVSLLAQERERTELARRFLNLGLLVLTGGAVAATWYLRNLKPVFDYLTGFGYGAQSSNIGVEHSLISWARWRSVAERMTVDDLLVPLAALVFIGLVAVAATAIRRVLNSDDRRSALAALARTDALSVAIIFTAGYVALTSSRNGGEGFTFPLTVLLPPLAILALCRFRSAVAPAVALLAIIAALNVAATSDIWDGLARTRLVAARLWRAALAERSSTGRWRDPRPSARTRNSLRPPRSPLAAGRPSTRSVPDRKGRHPGGDAGGGIRLWQSRRQHQHRWISLDADVPKRHPLHPALGRRRRHRGGIHPPAQRSAARTPDRTHHDEPKHR